MLKIQEIADLVGVSRTTVSNVLHGNTKKMSRETLQKISDILNKEGYLPNETPVSFSSPSSKIIGLVLGFTSAHGNHALQDPFIGDFISGLEEMSEKEHYYIMLINGENVQKVSDIASRWNIDGLIILGFTQEKYHALHRLLNKPMVFIDSYPTETYDYVNVGIDDHSGGLQIGTYLLESGHPKALFLAETNCDSDYHRWLGFKQGMELSGNFCSKKRFLLLPHTPQKRKLFYEKMLSHFLEAGALAFSADMLAIEAINFFQDIGICVPQQISVTGFDDCYYAALCRPRLTTIRQDSSAKGRLSLQLLIRQIQNLPIEHMDHKNPVQLICRDSVKTIS